MGDTEYLDGLVANIRAGISELNNFESQVLARPTTEQKELTLKAINAERERMSDFAKAVVLPARTESENE